MPQNAIPPTFETPLQYTSLPLRAANILRRHHIETVGELLQHSREELQHLHGFGKGCLAAVEELKRQVERDSGGVDEDNFKTANQDHPSR